MYGSVVATERRKNTREKIELGGLIMKAGLDHEKRVVLLGLLIDASLRLRNNVGERERLAVIGTAASESAGE